MNGSPNNLSFETSVPNLVKDVEALMSSTVAQFCPSGSRLSNAVTYAVESQGKRIRPLLAYATADLLGVDRQRISVPAAAIELLHTYSLVHDDLPAMDDDDLRRGRPTVHKAFDEATAILVGDALQTIAYQLLSNAEESPEIILRWIRRLSEASGPNGMILGQSEDLEGETRRLDLRELKAMHRKKTGALIEASVMCSTDLFDEQTSTHRDLAEFSRHLGLAFQIRDDILDVTGSTEELGKPSGSDLASNKSTFVSLLGVEGAQEKLDTECVSAQKCLQSIASQGDGLRWLTEFVVERLS